MGVSYILEVHEYIQLNRLDMKTNVTLMSEDRNLFGVIIRQETKTGFLNVSDLTKAYEIERAKRGWSHRTLQHILDSIENTERIYYILQKRAYLVDNDYSFHKTRNSVFYGKS